ncbi:IclR family transcriptional regulator [Mesorhizobium sp. LHD-90]|uniref:IclR family transcriptional regulator n=1 Tax=Mesorhizobium sp. LHD-90 TaxID=3071414 RepID=UPI0027DFA5B0|nr:IclR family transcriptional regulator [Mesorhizobium sp. LHD-90]MDQ6437513.1 IclR family transcriptional regulator [Mesorhizobium sp. LHD-90]
MGTVEKAVSLLKLFSVPEPEMGLSDLARKASFDKATTRRLLMALTRHGLVEQDADTRRYRLGAGVSRLARIRDAHFPFVKIALPIVRDLAAQTGETVHLSEHSADALLTVHVELSARANRVNVDVGQTLPLHATASGLAFLAFSRSEAVGRYADSVLEAFTAHTVTRRERLMDTIRLAASRGYSESAQGYEEGVHSVAAPILAHDGYAIGTLAVAAPVSRVDGAAASLHGQAVVRAARLISGRLNGEPPARG